MDEPTKSFAEQVAWWLWSAELVVYIATGVTLLFHYYPAFKVHRTRGLLLVVLSFGLDLFVTIFDRTIGQNPPTSSPQSNWAYYNLREVVWFAAVIIGTIGLLMFLRDYNRLASRIRPNISDSSTKS